VEAGATIGLPGPRPALSVCVATYKKHGPPNLRTLAEDLDAALDGLSGELIVFLNGVSADRVGVPPWAVVRGSPINLGVSPAWNVAAQTARSDSFVFVNDDVRLGPGSLRELWAVLHADESAGVVGPVGTRWDILEPRHVSHLDDSTLPPGTTQECEVVSGFLFATPRSVFEAVGGFDEAYAPCGFEEVDFCTSVRLTLGLRCLAVAGIAYDHHFRISTSRPWRRVRFNGRSESIGRIADRNRRHFRAKWQSLAARAQSPPPL
jgi:O-antigen biosynthesis protein